MGWNLELRNDSADDSDMLTSRNRRDPGLGQQDSVDSGLHGPRVHVDMIEIMKEAHDIAAPNFGAAFDDRFVVSIERSYRETVSIDHFQFSLISGSVIGDGLDRAFELAVIDGGR